MNREKAVALCELARTFRAGRKTINDILKDADIERRVAENSREILVEVLEERPELIDSWLAYSEDKRTSGAYFRTENGRYRVGWIHEGQISQQSGEIFDNRFEACARFLMLDFLQAPTASQNM